MADAMPQHRILHRKHDFYALLEIARHPVGARKIEFLLSSVGEVKNSAVFKKTAYDAAHANAVADATNPGTQGTHAPHQEIDLHTRLRGAVQPGDNIFVQQSIHLGNDARRPAETCMIP